MAGSKVGTVIGVRNKHGDGVMKHELVALFGDNYRDNPRNRGLILLISGVVAYSESDNRIIV